MNIVPLFLKRIVLDVTVFVIVSCIGLLLTKAYSGSRSHSHWSEHRSTIHSLIENVDDATTFEDIGGYTDVKKQLTQQVVIPIKYRHIFYDEKTPQIRPTPGILLSGPPGTGKTLLARACAKEAGATFIVMSASVLENKWWGESSKIVEAAFRVARQELSPCIMFFDELDGLGRKRSEGDHSCVYTLKCELLRNLDGTSNKGTVAPLVVIACTNSPESIDPAMRRRFHRHIEIPLPTQKERLEILKILTKEEAVQDLSMLNKVAEKTKGMSGADIASLFTAASSKRIWDQHINWERHKSGIDFAKVIGPLKMTHWESAGLPIDHQIKSISGDKER